MAGSPLKKARLLPPACALVDLIVLLCDAKDTHFHGLLPRLVALGCRELADLVFSGRLKLKGILIRSPTAGVQHGRELAKIQAGYERYRTWYPDIYTVVGVTATAPIRLRLRTPFYAFYDHVIFSHFMTIQVLTLDLLDADRAQQDRLAMYGFLDSVRFCTETRSLTLNLKPHVRDITAMKAQSVIKYMYNLEDLSFSGFSPCPYKHLLMADIEQRHLIMDLLPPSLVSLRLAGRVSPSMATYNELTLQELLDHDKLPSLTTVDLSDYRLPLKPPQDVPGLMMRLAHHNSRINRVLLPVDATSTYYSNLCVRRMFLQGQFLRARGYRHNFTLVVGDKDPSMRASCAQRLLKAIDDFQITNVQIEF